MKTPLIFKLILMLAVGLRLIKAQKKTPTIEEKTNYIDLDGFGSVPKLLIHKKAEESNQDFIKRVYRTEVRAIDPVKRDLNHVIIYMAMKLIRTFKKGNIFRFVWHQQELTLAFFQSLKLFAWHHEATLFGQLIEDLSGNSLEDKSGDFFPNPQKESEALNQFNKDFSLDGYLKAVIDFTCTS